MLWYTIDDLPAAAVPRSATSMSEDLATESRNPATMNLDALPTAEIVEAMHAADQEAVIAVKSALPQVTRAIDGIARCIMHGGRLFYVGAGTSGRLGVLDASECPPTFNTSPELVQGVIAGGDQALRHAIEGAEDDRQRGEQDLRDRNFCQKDALVGVAASGRTPYVLGGIAYARSLSALTIGLTCAPGSPLAEAAELPIVAATGAEVIAGSTRLKGGTATKMILNMLSTAVMVKLGYVHSNLMVNVQPTNDKLKQRAVRLITMIAEVSAIDAAALLQEGGSVKTAIVMSRLGVGRGEAEVLLQQAGGRLSTALAQKGQG